MNWIKERLQEFDERVITISDSGALTYFEFRQKVEQWLGTFDAWNINPGDRVGLVADYHIDVVAILQALLESGCIIIPLADDDESVFDERLETACANKLIRVTDIHQVNLETVICSDYGKQASQHPLMEPLRREAKAGFVIYTSGSTGKSKAVLLDYERMIKKYRDKIGRSFRTLLFLKLDHIGGINTLLSVMFNGGTIVTSQSRQAKDICRAIERHAVELLPTTPSFLTMLLMSNLYSEFDLSSLKVITYGTEVMPNSTLAAMNQVFPHVTLKQTYGLSELGILPTQSKSSESKWMKLGGAGFDIKVKDDILWIKSDQAMLGYLNAESPFDDEGWYNTGDKVECDGEYFRILGRESEIINVAGEKVFPIEIESYLLTLDNVRDVIVKGKKSPVTGQIIWAEFVLEEQEELAVFKQRIIETCRAYFPPFKVPGLITLANGDNLMGSRFKKIRKVAADSLV